MAQIWQLGTPLGPGEWRANGKGITGKLFKNQTNPHHWAIFSPRDPPIKPAAYFLERIKQKLSGQVDVPMH